MIYWNKLTTFVVIAAMQRVAFAVNVNWDKFAKFINVRFPFAARVAVGDEPGDGFRFIANYRR